MQIHLRKLGYLPGGPTEERPELNVDLRDGDDAEIVKGGLVVETVPSTADVCFSLQAVPNYPPLLHELARHFELSNTLVPAVQRFLYNQLNPDAEIMGMATDLDLCPMIDPFDTRVSVYHSAACLIQAPSNPSGPNGMCREYIRASPNWRNTGPRHDCVLIDGDPENSGFLGFNVGQVHFFFRFQWNDKMYDCAFLQWFEKAQTTACPNMGLWMVQPQVNLRKERVCSVVHIDTIYSAVHLIGSTGAGPTPSQLRGDITLRAYRTYYVNKYANSTLFELLK
ncbi:hypothetical protein NP233_g8526 [Leucocoprinus birnbaumii]|uniref:Uncharacterized protein n=1 Tax=Leucocoprinus birnbaumii TaxID=56174 RepID=A0AAD5VMD6_9AGAR|nr:hypothetical protein NP233_g8526 [Leucocoprinus birnbaumii]